MPTANTPEVGSQNGAPKTNGYHHDDCQNQEEDLIPAHVKKIENPLEKRVVGSRDEDIKLLSNELSTLYSAAIDAKVWSVASKALSMVRMSTVAPDGL